MIEKEARWIADELSAIDPPLVLNIGSSTLAFRKSGCIQRVVVSPLEARGGRWMHLDMKEEEGVDLAGDLMDLKFRDHVRKLRCDAVLCSNLLEHVTNPQQLCDLLVEVTPIGGYLIITVPRVFPYHSDPIDTMFRPSVVELTAMMSGCELVRGEELTIDGDSLAGQLKRVPKLAAIMIARTLMPFYKYRSWRHIVGYWPHTFKNFKVTCAVFKRVASGEGEIAVAGSAHGARSRAVANG